MRSSAALRSDIRNLVRALDVPRAPTRSSECARMRCRYSCTTGRCGTELCTLRGDLSGRPCPLYRKEGE